MNKKAVVIVFSMLIVSQAVYGSGKEGGGGDVCQNNIESIRNDISQWIANGGPKGLDFSNTNTNLENYDTKMQDVISLTRVDDQTSISCTDNSALVEVDGAQKTCVSYPDPLRPRILCYRGQSQNGQFISGFMGLSQDDQYFQVHHELAVLAGIEDQSGQDSDYPLSDQLVGKSGYPGFLVNEVVRKLAIQPQSPGHDFTITQEAGPNGIISGTTMSFSAINSAANPPITLDGPITPGTQPIDFGKAPFAASNYPIVNVAWNPEASQFTDSYVLVVSMLGSAEGVTWVAGQVIASPPGICPSSDCIFPEPTFRVTSSVNNETQNYFASYQIFVGASVQLSLDFRAMCDSYIAAYGGFGGAGCSELVNPTPSDTSGKTQLFLSFDIYAAPILSTTEPLVGSNSALAPVDSSGVMTINLSNSPSAAQP